MKKHVFLFWLMVGLIFTLSLPVIAQDVLYLDASQPVETRVEDLLTRMSLDEKIGQMTLVELGSINQADIAGKFLGGLLSGGGGSPSPNTPEAWADMVDGFQQEALKTQLAIPMIYGVDAVHGHNNVDGAVVFPHNVGLGATHNPELVKRIGQVTACNMIATGIYWNYAPVVAVTQDIRWGRNYEGYGSDTQLVTELSTAFIDGLQGESLDDPYTVLATPKHYIGDGGTIWGTSTTGNYRIDQGDAIYDEATLRSVFLPPYQAAVENGALVIMASFSSWNGVKMHGEKYLMTDVLKGELGFNGFIVSDWQGIDQVDRDFYKSVVTSINAGVDMNMVPYNYSGFINTMKEAVEAGDISLERIDDAVRRILRVKFTVGLFEQPFADRSLLEGFAQDSYIELARQAAAQSAVLLKNDNDVLPLSPDVKTVFLTGDGANDLGIQAGGWTLTWQGDSGNRLEGISIQDGIESTVSADTQVYVDRFGNFKAAIDANGNPINADVGIVVLAEKPYAEGVGDRANLNLTEAEMNLINKTRERSEKLIVILISGRPLLIEDAVNASDAFIAAWLPGSEGGAGIADVLFGIQPFTGTLSQPFPRDESQIPLSALAASGEAPLFPIGYGITTANVEDIELVEVSCGG